MHDRQYCGAEKGRMAGACGQGGDTSTTQPAARRAATGVPSLTKMSTGGTPSTSSSKPLSTAAMCAPLWPRSSSSSVA